MVVTNLDFWAVVAVVAPGQLAGRTATAAGEQEGTHPMHATIHDKRGALRELCEKFGVARLEVFGSAVRALEALLGGPSISSIARTLRQVATISGGGSS